MRIAWIIFVLTIIAVAMVKLRTKQSSLRAQTFRLELYRYRLRQQLWDRQVHLQEALSPTRMEDANRRMALRLQMPGVGVDDDNQIAQRD